MIHESGHALMALITNGKIERIDLFSDTSGQALTQSKNSFISFLVVFSGYPIASIATWGLFILLSRYQYNFILYLSVGLMLLNLIFWVRNWYGIIWLLITIAGLGIVIYYDHLVVKFLVSLLLCTIAFSEAIYSAWIVFYLSIKMPKSSGDAYLLSRITLLPPFTWGLIFFVQSLYFSVLSIIKFYNTYPISL